MTYKKLSEVKDRLKQSKLSSADYTFQSNQDQICPAFRVRAKAVKEIDPGYFNSKEKDIVKIALLAQDILDTAHLTGIAHVFEGRSGMWGDVKEDKIREMGENYGFSAEDLRQQPEMLVSLALARSFIHDRKNGIIDDHGNIINPEKFAKSSVMSIPHKRSSLNLSNAKAVMGSVRSSKNQISTGGNVK